MQHCKGFFMGGSAEMAKYENRSSRRSTSRHPIAMASTAKPPDPMPCAPADAGVCASRSGGSTSDYKTLPEYSPQPACDGGGHYATEGTPTQNAEYAWGVGLRGRLDTTGWRVTRGRRPRRQRRAWLTCTAGGGGNFD